MSSSTLERAGSRPPAWWGMVLLVTTEATIFVGLLSAYFFERAMTHPWPMGGIKPPDLSRPAAFSVLLVGSSIPIVVAERAARAGRVTQLRRALAVAFVMAAVFLVNQVLEQRDLGFGVRDNVYASLFVLITGLHGLHVLGALVMSTAVQAKAWTGRITPKAHMTLRVFGIYWHFVDAVWIAVFTSLYLTAHLGAH